MRQNRKRPEKVQHERTIKICIKGKEMAQRAEERQAGPPARLLACLSVVRPSRSARIAFSAAIKRGKMGGKSPFLLPRCPFLLFAQPWASITRLGGQVSIIVSDKENKCDSFPSISCLTVLAIQRPTVPKFVEHQRE